jgi:hypothetical protein
MVRTRLYGLGCAGAAGCGCNQEQKEVLASNYRSALYGNQRGWLPTLHGLGEVANYDQITIGGKQYSVNSIVGRGVSLTAAKATKIYAGTHGGSKVIATIKAGQQIGSPESYVRADQSADGNSWLMFYGSQTSVITGQNPNASGAFFVPNESVDPSQLKNQGVLTAEQEIKKEQEEKLKADNPVLYYAKKIALPALIGVGLIVVAKAYVSRPRAAAAAPAASTTPLSGPPARRKKKRRAKKK